MLKQDCVDASFVFHSLKDGKESEEGRKASPGWCGNSYLYVTVDKEINIELIWM